LYKIFFYSRKLCCSCGGGHFLFLFSFTTRPNGRRPP
jgi:hypothetical protein